MNKTKKIFRTYQKYAYNNVLNELIHQVLLLENVKEDTTDHDTFRDGWNTAIERVVELLEEQK